MDSQNRLLIALVLSVTILLAYQKLFVAPATQSATKQEKVEPENNRIITVSSKQPQPKTTQPEDVIYLENDVVKIELTDNNARIKQIWLKKFKETKSGKPIELLDAAAAEEALAGPLLLQDALLENVATQQKWGLANSNNTRAIYTLETPEGLLITKEIFLHNSNYSIWLRTEFFNKTDKPITIKYKLTGPSWLFVRPRVDEAFAGVDVKSNGEVARLTPRKTLKKDNGLYYENPEWVSARGRYFSLVLEPKQKAQSCVIEREGEKGARGSIIIGPTSITPKDKVEREFLLYAGPNDIEQIKKASPNLKEAVTFGKLTAISLVLLKLLRFFNSIFHNYGISIIILTAVINVFLFPLTTKSLKSMREMQRIQPEVEGLRTEYKDKPQKLNTEIMALYKKHKINPLGGCLPMVFQMPVFIALYVVLMKSIELKGAHFLWIKDLSEPDAAIRLPSTLPIIGDYINILPLLMIAGMYFQQKASQPKAIMSEQQKMMSVLMPFLFGFIFYNLPAGFVLYWLVNTVIMVILQTKASFTYNR